MSELDQYIIGLSGHIDHGKTSIVKALTNTNTDNLKEEQNRGMTINIGFAFLNKNITLIDVPGHEKFIKNMLAGVNAIDYALLVIAADDGIMPQTLEHFEILKLFGIKDGAIVLNKIDCVNDEWIELIEDEIKKLSKKTFLEGKKIYKVSALTNQGIEELKNDLINYKFNFQRNDRGIFQMYADRVFNSKGFGTVITGTVLSGEIDVGKKYKILPQDKEVKIRGLETHNSSRNQLKIGNRAAVNLQFSDKITIKRGNHLSSSDYFSVHEVAVVQVNVLSNVHLGIKSNDRLRIYIGTQEVMARINLFTNKILDPGKSSGALLKFEKPIILSINDNFIIRRFSPLLTIGGGKVLDFTTFNSWKNNKKYIQSLFSAEDKYKQLEIILISRGINPFNYITLSKYLDLSLDKTKEYLSKIKNIKVINNQWIIGAEQFNNIVSRYMKYFNDFHTKNPYRRGMIKEEIINELSTDTVFNDKILRYLEIDKLVKCVDNNWSRFDFKILLSKHEISLVNTITDIIKKSHFNPPSIKELINSINEKEQVLKKIIDISINNNNLILINGTLLFSKKNIDKMIDLINTFFQKNTVLDIKTFKSLTKTSRKYAVPLLEYLDKIGITYRSENGRKYKK